MMKYIYRVFILFLATTFFSCEKFLEETPNKSGSAYIYHMDQLYGLAGNYSLFQSGYPWTDLIFLGDGLEFSPYYTHATGLSGGQYEVWGWDLSYVENQNMTGTSWSPSYNAIYSSNTVLESLDKVTQTTPEIRKQVEGEALFTRAYFHFLILVQYALWDDDAPGIGYRTNTIPGEVPKRETVKYTLEKIYDDLEKAETLLKEAGRTQFDDTRKFRPTVITLKSLRARIDLYRGDYKGALQNAEDALAGYNFLLDFKNDPMYQMIKGEDIFVLNETNTDITDTINYRQLSLTGSGSTVWEYPEFYLPHISDLYYANKTVPISQSYSDLFDKDNDERWNFFYDNNYIVHTGRILKAVELPGKGLTNRCFTWEDQQGLGQANRHAYMRFAGIGSGKYYFLGMTTAEMYLIKAECLARDGKTTEAANALRTLRRTRFKDNTSADNIGGSLQEVLDERAREMAELWRFFDIKRLNGADNANIKVTRKYLTNNTDMSSEITIEIQPNDPRWAVPIDLKETILMSWEQNN